MRTGKIEISGCLLERPDSAMDGFFEWLSLTVVSCRSTNDSCLELTGVSEKFDEVPEGNSIPVYIGQVNNDTSGKYRFSLMRYI